VKFLKRLFGIGRKAGGSEDAPQLARELEATVAEAERLVAAGRFEEATQVAENGLKRFPTAVRLRAVIQYVRRVGANKRLAQLKKTIDERKDERAYRELIALHIDLGNRDQALEVAQRFLQEFPDSAEAHIDVGEVYLARYFAELFARDARAAFESFERALQLDERALRARVLMGLLYWSIGAPRHAGNEIAEVLRMDPANARLQDFRDQTLPKGLGEAEEEDLDVLLDGAEDRQELPNDPSVYPGGRRFVAERQGGALSPKLFAAAAAGIGRRLRIEQLAAIGVGGRPLAVAGEKKEEFVRLACRIDAAARRAGRHMNFGTMRRLMVEGKFGRLVLVPAGNCTVAARAPRTVSTERIAEGLEMVVTASRSDGSAEEE
jgi:tetratricopeptide (TPR) repeat protein